MQLIRLYPVLFLLFLGCQASVQAEPNDPWLPMQDFFPPEVNALSVSEQQPSADPWQELQEYFIPFTEEEELLALTSHQDAVELASRLHGRLLPYRAYIAEAAKQFAVPAEVIAAVIMVESSGNPQAKATTSSAKGLMQTIDTTFAMAQKALTQQGLIVADSPFDPQASIMAGSWYLGRMYDRAVNDGRLKKKGRTLISHWKVPVEYYYAGPGHGKKMNDVVITYAGGRTIVIDKPAYSQKVLRWATIMDTATN